MTIFRLVHATKLRLCGEFVLETLLWWPMVWVETIVLGCAFKSKWSTLGAVVGPGICRDSEALVELAGGRRGGSDVWQSGSPVAPGHLVLISRRLQCEVGIIWSNGLNLVLLERSTPASSARTSRHSDIYAKAPLTSVSTPCFCRAFWCPLFYNSVRNIFVMHSMGLYFSKRNNYYTTVKLSTLWV